MNSVADRHRVAAQQAIEVAQEKVLAGRRMIAEGQRLASEGARETETARMRLAMVEDFLAALMADFEAAVHANGTSATTAPTETTTVTQTKTMTESSANGRSVSLSELLDALMADRQVHTVRELHEALLSRGLNWSRQSVANRCSERARQGIYENVKRGAYKLAARAGGDQLPSGSANPEGGRVPQPESDSRNGSGQVQEAGSLAI